MMTFMKTIKPDGRHIEFGVVGIHVHIICEIKHRIWLNAYSLMRFTAIFGVASLFCEEKRLEYLEFIQNFTADFERSLQALLTDSGKHIVDKYKQTLCDDINQILATVEE